MSLTSRHRWTVVCVASHIHYSTRPVSRAGDAGARVAAPARWAAVGAKVEAVVAAHAAGHV